MARILQHWRIALLSLLIAGFCAAAGYQFGVESQPQLVLHSPKEGDLVILNGCVVSACQVLASVRVHHKLEPQFWSRVMLVKYQGTRSGHAYCVWETDGVIFGYDRNGGSFTIPGKDRDAEAIARALAGELSRVLKKDMTVARAEFIEPSEAQIHAY